MNLSCSFQNKNQAQVQVARKKVRLKERNTIFKFRKKWNRKKVNCLPKTTKTMLSSNSKSWITNKEKDGDLTFKEHPTQICESIHLSNIEPPPLQYKLHIDPSHLSFISTFQEETVRQICQSFFKEPAWFLLSDSTGTGKSRIISSTILEFKALGRRSLWVTSCMKLRESCEREMEAIGGKKTDFMFSSYGTLKRSVRSIKDFLLPFGDRCRPLVILDECHIFRSKDSLPEWILSMARDQGACILLSSATPASHPKQLAYLSPMLMADTSILTKIHNESEKCGGPSCLELISLQMKREGKFLSRYLSLQGVSIRIHTFSLDSHDVDTYDSCVCLLKDLDGKKTNPFFQRLICSFKWDPILKLIHQCLQEEKSVIITLQHTGESDIVKEEHVPGMERVFTRVTGGKVFCPLPDSLLDNILFQFGEENVAELSGRKIRPVKTDLLSPIVRMEKTPNILSEVDAFQSNKKRIAVMTKAGGTGISLHDCLGRKRVHILAELPWSAEECIQQLGRSHRSGQTSQPEYILLASNMPSEMRFVTSVKKRMESLGAISMADSGGAVWMGDVAWTAKTRRMAMLELMYRDSRRKRKQDEIRNTHIYRGLERQVEEDPDSEEDVGIVPRFRRRRGHSQSNPLSHCKALCDARSSYERDFAIRNVEEDIPESFTWKKRNVWSDRTHPFHSTMQQKRILTFLISCRHDRILSTLPCQVQSIICEKMCERSERESLAQELQEWGWKMDHPTMDNIYVLNSMLRIPFSLQTKVMEVLNDHTVEKKEMKIPLLQDWILSKVRMQGKASVFTYHEDELDLTITYEPRQVVEEIESSSYWKRYDNLLFCQEREVNDREYVNLFKSDSVLPRLKYSVDTWKRMREECTFQKMEEEEGRQLWQEKCQKSYFRVQHKLQSLPNRLYLEKKNILSNWNNSMKQLVTLNGVVFLVLKFVCV